VTGLVAVIRATVERTLDVPIVGEASYVALGGSSLGVLEIITSLHEVLGVEIWPDVLFDGRSIDAFIEHVVELAGSEPHVR
jgi:acyl carrier protein